jgi:ABC-type branched-subunit amino acid transport system ATPase component
VLFGECDEQLNKGKHEFRHTASISGMKMRFADLSSSISAARTFDAEVARSLASIRPDLLLLSGPADGIRQGLPSSVGQSVNSLCPLIAISLCWTDPSRRCSHATRSSSLRLTS